MTAVETSGKRHCHKLGILRGAATGAAAFVLFYLLCWLGAALGLAYVSHMYLALFTSAEITSATALVTGLCLSFGFGAFAGALLAICYNLFGFLEPR